MNEEQTAAYVAEKYIITNFENDADAELFDKLMFEKADENTRKDMEGQPDFEQFEIAENTNRKVAWLCKCTCGNMCIVLGNYLKNGDTTSCGCEKKRQDHINLRQMYDAQRIDDIPLHLYTNKARKDSKSGYKGVEAYKTRVKKEIKYRAYINVKGERYYKSGFSTPEEAYETRMMLEHKYLPKKGNSS